MFKIILVNNPRGEKKIKEAKMKIGKISKRMIVKKYTIQAFVEYSESSV